MYSKFSMTIAALLLSASTSVAATFSLPGTNAIATIDIPDSWQPTQVDGNVEGLSPDGKVYANAKIVQGKDVADAADAGGKWFESKGVKFDESSYISKDFESNGMKGFNISVLGTDNIGKTQVSMSFFQTKNPEEFVMVSIWGDESLVGQNLTDVNAIGASVKPAN